MRPVLAAAADTGPVDPRLAEFRRQAFLAALAGIMASPLDWKIGEQPATNIQDRVELAWRTADAALLKSGLLE